MFVSLDEVGADDGADAVDCGLGVVAVEVAVGVTGVAALVGARADDDALFPVVERAGAFFFFLTLHVGFGRFLCAARPWTVHGFGLVFLARLA